MDFEQTLLNLKDFKQRIEYAATLPEKLVLEICAKNTDINQTVCLNEDYWKIRYLSKNKPPDTTPISWKELYLFSPKNEVYSCGFTEVGDVSGQLGLGDVGDLENVLTLTKIPNIEAKQIAAGDMHSLLIDLEDNVLSFGNNEMGQLGLGDDEHRISPTKIPSVSDWDGKVKQIACGNYFSLIIGLDDIVRSFGSNEMGQLGLGDVEDEEEHIPVKIPPTEYIKAKNIICKNDFSFIINWKNEVFGFGYAEEDVLGIHTNEEHIDEPTKLYFITAKQIAIGNIHSLLIDSHDDIWVFGSNYDGQLGLGSTTDSYPPTKLLLSNEVKPKFVACGTAHSLIIDSNDEVWSFGLNDKGQLGLGDNDNRTSPTKIKDIKAKYIACGSDFTFIIDLEDTVWAFGNNEDGQLGLGDKISKNTPTKVSGINGKVLQIAGGKAHTLMLIRSPGLLPFDDIMTLFSQGQIVKFEIEHNLQIPHNALQGIYVGTFIDKQENKKYGYIKYNQQTNQILKP